MRKIENAQPAGFAIRLLALATSTALGSLPHVLFWFFTVPGIKDLASAAYAIILYVSVLAIPLSLANWLINHVWLNSKFGGNLGKLVTGLRVTDEDGSFLPFAKSWFRFTVGYTFSFIFFGLGFLSVIKDKNKQAWHDKAVGSRVWVVQNLWPVSLILLVTLISLEVFLVNSTISTISKGPLPQEVSKLFSPEKPEIPPAKLPSSPAPFEEKFQVN